MDGKTLTTLSKAGSKHSRLLRHLRWPGIELMLRYGCS